MLLSRILKESLHAHKFPLPYGLAHIEWEDWHPSCPEFIAVQSTKYLLHTVKPVLNGHSQKDQKMVFKTNYL